MIAQQDKQLVAAFRRAYAERSITALIAVNAYEQMTRGDVSFPHRVVDRDATALLAREAHRRAGLGEQIVRRLNPSPSQEEAR